MKGVFYIVLGRLSIVENFAAGNNAWLQVTELYMSGGLIYSSDWLLLTYISDAQIVGSMSLG